MRSDHFLHCYDLSSGKPIEVSRIQVFLWRLQGVSGNASSLMVFSPLPPPADKTDQPE